RDPRVRSHGTRRKGLGEGGRMPVGEKPKEVLKSERATWEPLVGPPYYWAQRWLRERYDLQVAGPPELLSPRAGPVGPVDEAAPHG
ncbi:hypothetical protein B296_00046000, partial [Ensete ventricosum]